MRSAGIIAVLVATMANATTLAAPIEGQAHGLVSKPFSPSETPLLDSFYFQYVRRGEYGGSVDHHIMQIVIAPNTDAGEVVLGYHDVNLDDYYNYKVEHTTAHDPRIRRYTRSLDVCNRNKCTATLARPSGDFIFVLIGFQLSYYHVDHHLDEIGLLENSGQLTVWLNDRNDDDTFLWSVQYAYVPRDLFSRVDRVGGSRERRGSRRFVEPGRSVVRGFRFNFEPYFTSGGDHHIGSIGVLTPDDGRVEVWYCDKNEDDGFDWEVEWATLR